MVTCGVWAEQAGNGPQPSGPLITSAVLLGDFAQHLRLLLFFFFLFFAKSAFSFSTCLEKFLITVRLGKQSHYGSFPPLLNSWQACWALKSMRNSEKAMFLLGAAE